MAGRIVTDIYRELHIILLAQSSRTPQFVPQRRSLVAAFLDGPVGNPLPQVHRLRAFCQTAARTPVAGELSFALVLQLALQGLPLDWSALDDDSHLTPLLYFTEPVWPLFFCVNVQIPGGAPVGSMASLDLAVGRKSPEGEPLVGMVQLLDSEAPTAEVPAADLLVPCWRLREATFYAHPYEAAETLLRWVGHL